jgi:integrase/recombinase XerD
MTPIASHITAFLRERLPLQRRASHHTCESYAYTFQLLFAFASARLALTPSDLCLEHLDAQLVMDFLAHLETQRGNGPSTRNTRLAGHQSLYALRRISRPVEPRTKPPGVGDPQEEN